jgi:hypothetical protein
MIDGIARSFLLKTDPKSRFLSQAFSRTSFRSDWRLFAGRLNFFFRRACCLSTWRGNRRFLFGRPITKREPGWVPRPNAMHG